METHPTTICLECLDSERVVYAKGICKRCYDKEQYQKHRAKKMESARQYRADWTPEQKKQNRARQERWRQNNREKIRQQNRESTERQRAADPVGYLERQRASTRKTFARRRAIIAEAKKVPCTDCGGTFPPAAMDFHHTDPTTKSFTVAAGTNKPKQALLDEIDKCIVLCSNCHRIRHNPDTLGAV